MSLQCHAFKNQYKYTLKEKQNEDSKDKDDFSNFGHGIDVNKQPNTMDDFEEEDIVLHAADYCQNYIIPHLGEDQPGDVYYFSPISIYCLVSAML